MNTLSKGMMAVLSGALVACGSYFQPAQEVSTGAPQLSHCEKMATIDDFEDANNQIALVEGRGGFIYTYTDEHGTRVEFPSGEFRAYPGGIGDSKFVARFRGKTGKGGADIYAGLGMGLSAAGPSGTFDASKYTGVSFIAKRGSADSLSAVRFSMPDVNTDPEGKVCSECFNHFGFTVKLTDQWTRYVIFFDDMKQLSGWGAPRPTAIEHTALIGAGFQFSAPDAKFDLMVDDIRFIGACGEPWALRDEPAPAPEPAPEPELAPEPAPEPTTEPADNTVETDDSADNDNE